MHIDRSGDDHLLRDLTVSTALAGDLSEVIITVDDLLRHTSGLPPGGVLSGVRGDRERIPGFMARVALAADLSERTSRVGRNGRDRPLGRGGGKLAQAAGRIGLKAAVPLLVIQLSDPVWWVRFRAGEALARLGVAGKTLLARIAGEGDEVASTSARLTLEERGLA